MENLTKLGDVLTTQTEAMMKSSEPANSGTRSSTEQSNSEVSESSETLENLFAECERHGRFKAFFVTPTGIKVRCLCPSCLAEQKAEEEAKRAEAQREQIQKTLKSSCIPPRFANCTLENYIAYSDDIAYVKQNVTDFAEAFLAKQNHGENLLFVGTHGTGKTHLACALVSLAITHGFSALFTSVPEIVRRIRRTWRSIEDEDSLYRLYLSLDLLVIDEIGVQTGSENEKGIIFKILDDRYNFFKPTILISNLSLTEIRGYLGERTFDRITDTGSTALSFNWTSYRKKVQ